MNRHIDGQRASIGDQEVTNAVVRINEVMKAEIAMNIEKEFTAMHCLNMFFPDDLQARLMAVRHCVTPQSQIGLYPIGGDKMATCVNWTKTGIPTPSPDAMQPHHDRMDLFFSAIDTIRAARIKYGKVVYLLRWFNQNATPAAVRNFWPSALALVPGSKFAVDNAEAPSRYSSPQGIGKLLPLLRETSGTVAGMQLIPRDFAGRKQNQVWLTMPQIDIITEDQITVPIDHAVVNL
jgi:hypothetical protein